MVFPKFSRHSIMSKLDWGSDNAFTACLQNVGNDMQYRYRSCRQGQKDRFEEHSAKLMED